MTYREHRKVARRPSRSGLAPILWPSVLLLGLAALLAGCASTWSPSTTAPGIVLQWPFQPHPPKLTYLRALTGFGPAMNAGGRLRALAFGESSPDRSSFLLPVAVATGADGRIAVADMARRCVHLFIPAEQRYLQLVGAKERRLVSPVALAFGEESRLYVSDSTGQVVAFGPRGEVLFSVDRAGAEPLRRPTGIAYSPTRKLLYVVDTLANKIYALRPNGELAFSFGERGEAHGRFNFPTHLFRDASGRLYVTDALNFRIEIFDEDGHSLGGFGRHGDGSGDMGMPKGVAVDRDGTIYVVDGLFDNVQLFGPRGDYLLTVGRHGVDFGEFWLPSAAFISDKGELYVCDTYNRRVQVFRITERYAPSAP